MLFLSVLHIHECTIEGVWTLVSRLLFHTKHKFWTYFAGKWLNIFLVVSSELILIFLNSCTELLNFLIVSSKCSSTFFKFLLILAKYFSKFSRIIFKIFWNISQTFNNCTHNFFVSISWNFPKYFSKICEQLALMLDNVSYSCMSQLPAQVTQHEIEADCKQERGTKYGDWLYCWLWVWFLFVVYLSHLSLRIIGYRIIGRDPDLHQNVVSNALCIFPLKTENWYFLTKAL